MKIKPSRLVFALSIAGIFWVLIRWIEILDWGKGCERAWVTLLLFLLITGVFWNLGFRTPHVGAFKVGKTARWIFVITCLLLLSWQARLAFTRMQSPRLIDVATTTLEAAKALKNGQNPYTIPMDPRPESKIFHKNFDGFKYLPAMALSYLSATFRGDSDLILLNYIFHVLTAMIVFLISRRIAGDIAGAAGILFYLSIPLLPRELFKTGVTDLAAVLPCLLAFYIRTYSSLLCGIFVGFSFSAKLLPALLLLPVLGFFPKDRQWKHFTQWGIGFIIGNLPTLWFLIQSPIDLVNNTFLYSLYRETDSTSWMYGMAPQARSLASLANLLILIMVTLYCCFKTLSQRSRIFLAMGVTLIAPLLGPINHRNYQIWWLPWFSIVIGLCIGSFMEKSSVEPDPL